MPYGVTTETYRRHTNSPWAVSIPPDASILIHRPPSCAPRPHPRRAPCLCTPLLCSAPDPPSETVQVPWEAWGPSAMRWFEGEPASMRWITTTAGQPLSRWRIALRHRSSQGTLIRMPCVPPVRVQLLVHTCSSGATGARISRTEM